MNSSRKDPTVRRPLPIERVRPVILPPKVKHARLPLTLSAFFGSSKQETEDRIRHFSFFFFFFFILRSFFIVECFIFIYFFSACGGVGRIKEDF